MNNDKLLINREAKQVVFAIAKKFRSKKKHMCKEKKKKT